MKGRTYLGLALFISIFFACENEEEGLRADQFEGEVAPLAVSFTTSSMFLEVSTTNTSQNARSYAWDFGVAGSVPNIIAGK